MKIAICDDLEKDIARLSGILGEYLSANGLDADVDIFTSGEALIKAFQPGKYQIIFQDIYMGGMTGMQVCEKIRETDRDVSLILTTTSLEHGIASYKVNAAYYIVKPVDSAELAQAMEKCRSQIERFAKTIEVIENRQPVRIRLRDIYFVESQSRECVFTTASGEVRTNAAIDTMAERLGGFPFLRCHRSFIVNLLHISDMTQKDFVMDNGRTVPISKAYQVDSRKMFKEYFRAKMQGKPL